MSAIKLTQAAQENVAETGCDPAADVAEIRRGKTSRAEFLQFCLNGADRDRVQGWHDYTDALFDAVERLELLERMASNEPGIPHEEAMRRVFGSEDQ